VTKHRQGVSGQKTAHRAALEACREKFPSAERNSREFSKCVSSTRTLIQGLRGLKAQS
jgi:hypothetical protein